MANTMHLANDNTTLGHIYIFKECLKTQLLKQTEWLNDIYIHVYIYIYMYIYIMYIYIYILYYIYMNILLYIYCAEQVQKCRIGDIVSKRSKANGKERISAFYIASQQYHFTLYMQSFSDLNHFESALLLLL